MHLIKNLRLLVFLVFSASLSMAADLGKRVPTATPQALLRVLVAPQDFVGQPIVIAGVFSWGFEDQFLFLTHDHFAMYDVTSAIPLTLDETNSGISYADLKPYQGYRVKLEGMVLEVKRDKALVKELQKAGYPTRPSYYFRFSRLVSYGPAEEKVSNHTTERASPSSGVSP